MNEYDGEVIRGLPGVPPAGERILWQGSPNWRTLALRAFRVRAVAVYFGLLMFWQAGVAVYDGGGLMEAGLAILWIVPLGLIATGLLALLAYATARATMFTITSRRVVLRFGVALPMAVNLPFRKIGSAAMRLHPDGSGDIPLKMDGRERVSTVMLWPYVRSLRLGRPEPMLRAVPNAQAVARILADALVAYGVEVGPAEAEAPAAAASRQATARSAPEPVLRDAHA